MKFVIAYLGIVVLVLYFAFFTKAFGQELYWEDEIGYIEEQQDPKQWRDLDIMIEKQRQIREHNEKMFLLHRIEWDIYELRFRHDD